MAPNLASFNITITLMAGEQQIITRNQLAKANNVRMQGPILSAQ